MKGNHKLNIRNTAYILMFIVILCLTLCMMKGVRSTQYYKQYGNPEVKKDEQSGRMHTPYLSLPPGDYELIVGYSAASDLNVKAGNGESLLKASEGESESFQAFNVSLSEPSDDFCLSWKEDEASEAQPQIYEYELKTAKPYNSDAVFIGILFFCFFEGLLLLKYFNVFSKMSREKVLVLALITASTVLACLPLFRGYLVYGHDLLGHLKRIEGLKTAIYQGHFIPLVYPGVNNGYGEAAVCYPYLFLYIPALLRLMNVSMPFAYNTLLFLVNLGTAVFSYLSFKALTKDGKAAAVGACLYLLFPYRLSDLYIRAALGESIAMTFLPLILWGIYEIIFGEKKKWYILAAGFVGLIGSHILSIGFAGLFVLFMTLVFIARLIREKRIFSLLKAGLICLLLAIPQAMMLKIFNPYINLSDISVGNFYRYALYPAQLFMNDVSVFTLLDLKEGIANEMTQGIGLTGGAILLLIMLRLFGRSKNNSFISAVDVFAIILIFAATTLCPWNYLANLPVFKTVTGMIQFPLRFLSLASLILSAEAAVFISDIRKDRESVPVPYYVPAALLLTVTVLSASALTDTVLREDVLKTDIDGGFLTTPYTEYMPENTPPEVLKDTEPHASNVLISEYAKRGNGVYLSYGKETGEASVLLPLFYYPGYKAVDDGGNLLQIKKGDGNRIEVVLPEDSIDGSIRLDNSIAGLLAR